MCHSSHHSFGAMARGSHGGAQESETHALLVPGGTAADPLVDVSAAPVQRYAPLPLGDDDDDQDQDVEDHP